MPYQSPEIVIIGLVNNYQFGYLKIMIADQTLFPFFSNRYGPPLKLNPSKDLYVY